MGELTGKNKRFVALSGILFLTLHFVVTVIYVLPSSWKSEGIDKATYYYMVPVFHQNWNIFAPEPPTTNDCFLYRVKSDGFWENWTDPGKELLEKHYKNRFGNYGKQLNIYERLGRKLSETQSRLYNHPSIRDLDNAVRLKRAEELSASSVAYRLAMKFAIHDALQHRSGYDFSNVEIKFVQVPHNDHDNSNELKFPVYQTPPSGGVEL